MLSSLSNSLPATGKKVEMIGKKKGNGLLLKLDKALKTMFIGVEPHLMVTEYRSVSRCQRNDHTGSEQSLNMAAILITALTSFFSEEPRSNQCSENHYKSGHVELFQYSNGVIGGTVHASMKEKAYKGVVRKFAHL